MKYQFGKLPARPDAIELKLGDVLNAAKLPTPPKPFGHVTSMPDGNWFMLGNDKKSNCTIAGGNHEHMIWTMAGGVPRARFTTKDSYSDYFALTGGDDNGLDMQTVCAYRQKIGLLDATGVRHKIDAYADLKPGNLDELALAAWLFGAAGVGVECPSSMESQFDSGQPWSVVDGDRITGGHYIPCVGRNSTGNFLFITWGRLQAATPEWVQKYMDEGVAYLSMEIINTSTKLSPEGFNPDALTQYLRGLT